MCDTANLSWLDAHPHYAEEIEVIRMTAAADRKTVAIPPNYRTEAETILSMLPEMMTLSVTRCALEGVIPTNVTNLMQMEALVRMCVDKSMLFNWNDYLEHIMEEMLIVSGLYDVSLALPWDNPQQTALIITQMSFIEQAVVLVVARVHRTWELFLSLLLKQEDFPLNWITGEQLVDVLRKQKSGDVLSPLENGLSPSKCLLVHLFRFMSAHLEDDTQAATLAARAVESGIRSAYRKPVVDVLHGPELYTAEILNLLRDVFDLDCSRLHLAEMLHGLSVMNRNLDRQNLFGVVNRFLVQLPIGVNIQRRSHRPVKTSMLRALSVRALIGETFFIAYRREGGGVHHTDLVKRIEDWQRRWAKDVTLYSAYRDVILTTLRVMLGNMMEFGATAIAKLASMITGMALGTIPLNVRGMDKISLHLAKLVVTREDDVVTLDFSRLADFICSLPAPNPRHSYEMTPFVVRPQPFHRRADIAASCFLEDTPLDWLEVNVKPARVAILLDGQSTADDLFSEEAVDPLHEFSMGMPTPRMLAAKLDRAMRDGTTDGTRSLLACALLWNMAKTVRWNASAYEEHTQAPAKKRKPVARPAGPVCMACMDSVAAPESLLCGHAMCHRCASKNLEMRVANLAAGDGCMQEQIHGQLLKCPVPDCHFELGWAVSGMSTDTRFLLHRLQTAASVQSLCAGAHAGCVQCFQCWDAAKKGGDGVATCGRCGYDTCCQCGNRSHPGDVCPATLRKTGHALEDILSEAKWQSCPNPDCGMKTTKASGCNHMTCVKCSWDWCWACAAVFPRGDVTEHYSMSATCSLLGYSAKTETERMQAAIRKRSDISEEHKEAALRMLLLTNFQTTGDI
jgi:hypothetical protein